ncbi:MAG: flavin-containing monooxygenase [Panacagrimonas sp.]
MKQTQSPQQVDAVVVGAGFAGMYGLYRLREKGLTVQGIEAGSSVGGTWYWNRYPGARVDSQSEMYQYWFSDELLNEWDWSERFPAQPETERYLNRVADKFGLRDLIRFNTRVTSAVYDESARRWTVTTDDGKTVSAQFLLMSTGGLSAPMVPPFPGHEKFKGKTLHTAHWPKEGVDFAGKRVGVIGTGATGIQVIQTIAEKVKQLTVFQRTANFTVPMRNPKYGDADRAAFRAQYPDMKEKVHSTFAGFAHDFDERSFYDLSPAERQKVMEQLWADGSLSFWIAGFREVFFDAKVADEFSQFVNQRIRARVKDPEVAEKLVPKGYGFGSRRVPLETNYYEAYNRDNVQLVDVNEEPIECITGKGIKTSKGEYELDILVFATGFDGSTGALTQIDIRGRNGVSLREQWAEDVRTTIGMQVHGYPNMFLTMAPYSPAAAFCNVPTCLQQQVDWIKDCIDFVRNKGKQTVEPTVAAEEAWIAHHEAVAAMTLVAKTDSWYTGANVKGKRRRLLPYPGGVNNYKAACDAVKAKDYEGFEIA